MLERCSKAVLAVAAVMLGPTAAAASGLWGPGPETVLPTTETVAIEPFVGYLRGTAGEYVYSPTNPKQKVSQLDWAVNGLAVGGRIAFRPFNGVTIRGRGWATVASGGGEMTDFDWLLGYFGKDSWTHRSHHPDTKFGDSWQADISAAVTLWGEEDLAVTAIGGFRRYEIGYASRGGSFVYSTDQFRDTLGSFAPGQTVITYQQQWDTPYLGVGVTYNTAQWTVSTELIGSPFVMGRAKDHHVLRSTVFTDELEMSSMIGLAAGFEYRFSPIWSLAGRVEYQKYFEAQGSTTVTDTPAGTTTVYPKPSAGADAESALVTLGVKARL